MQLTDFGGGAGSLRTLAIEDAKSKSKDLVIREQPRAFSYLKWIHTCPDYDSER